MSFKIERDIMECRLQERDNRLFSPDIVLEEVIVVGAGFKAGVQFLVFNP
jgi:hypothetical protein